MDCEPEDVWETGNVDHAERDDVDHAEREDALRKPWCAAIHPGCDYPDCPCDRPL